MWICNKNKFFKEHIKTATEERIEVARPLLSCKYGCEPFFDNGQWLWPKDWYGKLYIAARKALGNAPVEIEIWEEQSTPLYVVSLTIAIRGSRTIVTRNTLDPKALTLFKGDHLEGIIKAMYEELCRHAEIEMNH